MLVLSRRLNERILLPTVPAAVQVVSIKPGVVRLGIEAPAQVPKPLKGWSNRAAK